ncbi:hypothetical protein ACP70R_042289 [Stipagrostis hirtigluma subsp. patula]
MMKAAGSAPWSDLQPELLGLVLRRLHFLADRVRLRAVCRPWRYNARLHTLPPPLPWLTLLDGTFLSIPGGEIIRMPVPDDACCHGSLDGWLFLMQSDGRCSLMNPFSKAKVDLPKLATVWPREPLNANSTHNPLFYKLVVASPLDSASPNSLFAALIFDDGGYTTVCVFQSPIARDYFLRGRFVDFVDVVFFGGKLYGVAPDGRLSIVEMSYGLSGEPKISSIECIIKWNSVGYLLPTLSKEKSYIFKETFQKKKKIFKEYLVECCGRLLTVTRLIEIAVPRATADDFFKLHRTVAFDVFEADLSTKPAQWRRVNKLDGQALFVGKHCSKSFPAGDCSGIHEDCIYFMCDCPPIFSADPSRDSGVYNMKTGIITPLLLETATVQRPHGGQWRPAWFFPADVV